MNIYALSLLIILGAALLFFSWKVQLYTNWFVSISCGFVVGIGAIMATPDVQTLPEWVRLAYCLGVGLFYRYGPLLLGSPPRAVPTDDLDVLNSFFDEVN